MQVSLSTQFSNVFTSITSLLVLTVLTQTIFSSYSCDMVIA